MSRKPSIIQIHVTQDDVIGLIDGFDLSEAIKADFVLFKLRDEQVSYAAYSPAIQLFSDEKIAIVGLRTSHLSRSRSPQGAKPETAYVPTTKANDVLIRRNLLDEFYAELRNEFGDVVTINDISVFINRFGYSTVEVFVSELVLPKVANIPRLAAQQDRSWTSYVQHVENFLSFGSDNFNSAFYVPDLIRNPNLLVDATGLPNRLNGTSRVARGILQVLEDCISTNKFVNSATVVVPGALIQELGQQMPHINFVDKFPEIQTKFSMGLSITPVTSLQQCFDMSARSLRWAVLQLDLIAIRSYPHLSQQVSALEALRFVHRYADVVYYISSFAADDAKSYLNEPIEVEQIVCLLGIPDSIAEIPAKPKSFNSSKQNVFILGNDDPHKQVERIAKTFLQSGIGVSTITSNVSLGEQHNIYLPGSLSDSELSRLLQESSVVIFPSLYEGFGLPVVEAAKSGRPVLVWDTTVNRELIDKFRLKNVFLCSSSKELVDIYQQVQGLDTVSQSHLRTMSQFNTELVDHFTRTLSRKVDYEYIAKRWAATSLLGSAFEESQRKISDQTAGSQLRGGIRIFLWKLGNKLISIASNK